MYITLLVSVNLSIRKNVLGDGEGSITGSSGAKRGGAVVVEDINCGCDVGEDRDHRLINSMEDQ